MDLADRYSYRIDKHWRSHHICFVPATIGLPIFRWGFLYSVLANILAVIVKGIEWSIGHQIFCNNPSDCQNIRHAHLFVEWLRGINQTHHLHLLWIMLVDHGRTWFAGNPESSSLCNVKFASYTVFIFHSLCTRSDSTYALCILLYFICHHTSIIT